MKIKHTDNFKKAAKRISKKYPSFKEDFTKLVLELEKNPYYGTPIGKDCYKARLRISSKNKGKSGGARVITHVKAVKDTVYLLSIYDKSEQENISNTQIETWLKELESEQTNVPDSKNHKEKSKK